MKPALHIFQKDARRLWPGVAVSLGVLVMLARADRWRADSMIGSTEGWLNLLLPLVWACLTGLAVLEESLTGDRHFWLTRPYRRPALAAAKLLFALVFVHVPVLIADSYILSARGFPPFECLLPLAGKQAMLAAAVTLPAMALAALAGGFTQFMMLLVAAAAAAIFAAGGPFRGLPSLQRPEDYLRADIVASMVAVGAIAVLGVQYRRRRRSIGGTVALVTGLSAGVLFGYVPDTFDYRVRAVLHPAAALGLRIDRRPPDVPRGMAPGQRETVAIPVALSGVPAGALYHIGPVDLTLSTRDGSWYRSTTATQANQYEKVLLDAALYRFPHDLESAPLTLLLRFDRRLYEKLGNQHVRATGRIPVSFYRLGETAWMPMYGQAIAPGVGHCSNSISETRWSEGMIKVLCESPSTLPGAIRVTVEIAAIGRQWNGRLGNFGNPTSGPQWPWLSPLDRAKTFFNISDPRMRRYPYYMEVPLEHLAAAKISITPEVPTGYNVVDFDFPDVALADNRVRPASER
jgi:hypothetical protein